MANTLTGLIPVIYAGMDVVSREMVGFTRAVSLDSSAERAALNQSITSPVVPEGTLENITPGTNPADSGDQTIGTVTMQITKSKAAPIRWTGEEQISVGGNLNTIMVDQFAQAMRALVNAVEVDCGAQYAYASRAYGTAGTTPFGTAGDLSDIAQTLKILEDNGAPMTDRHNVLGSAAVANIRGKQSGLFEVNRAGNDELLRTGALSNIEGYALHNSAGVASHTKGTGTGYLVDLTAGYDEGDTTIHVDTGAGTILAGDVVTFEGDTNKYLVTTGFAGDGDGDIVIAAPGLQAALANNTAMTIGANYTANMAFTRNAIHLAARAPAMPQGENGAPLDSAADVMNITDPRSNLTFQVAMYAQYRRIKYEVCLAWGVKTIKPEHLVLLLG